MSRNLTSNPSNFFATFIRHYIVAALWSSTNEGEQATSENLDGQYDGDDIAMATYMAMVEDCANFIGKMIENLSQEELAEIDAEQCGHDFWLTRNGHGTGFWDRKELEANGLGDRLTELAKQFGECNLEGDGTYVYKL